MSFKTALVTGASRGIGRSIALTLAANGYHLMITCHKNSDMLEHVKHYIESHFPVTCITFAGDLGDYHTVQQMYDKFTRHFSSLDVLVNNAGISYIGLLTDLTPEEWDRILQTNLSSVFYTCRLGIPLMLRRKNGKIVNISSVWGVVGASCETAYSATKGGVNALTKALAKELAPSNIQVNAIACGVIDTEMNGFLSSDERAALKEEIPAGRFASPGEVADLAISLCGGHSYLTGQIITLDGGWI